MSRIASYKPCNMVDGQGVRNSVYFAGCEFNCFGCYNKAIQNFNAQGIDYNAKVRDVIVEELNLDYIQGISILGGEPLHPKNIVDVCDLVASIKDRYGDKKDIWLWTGYTYEELKARLALADKYFRTCLYLTTDEMHSIRYLLRNIDVLVDGRFDATLHKNDLTFRGSSNQRIILCKESFAGRHKKLYLWKNGDYK